VLGATGLTAYFGLLETGALSAGETVLVSAAAGATGSLAVQVARLLGARVIGIAGGAEKCAWVRDALGAAGVIDYRNEDVAARLGELCPGGVDVYFDNVGGAILEAAIEHIAPRGRIVLCGQIADYDTTGAASGPRNLMKLIMRRARMEGFLVLDHLPRAGEAMAQLGGWLAEGKLQWAEDVQHGFDNIPRTLMRLFRGENRGKQLLRI
jgi:NADPH-dependent curcumin reductase CurA